MKIETRIDKGFVRDWDGDCHNYEISRVNDTRSRRHGVSHWWNVNEKKQSTTRDCMHTDKLGLENGIMIDFKYRK